MGLILILIYSVISALGMIMLRMGSVQSTFGFSQGIFSLNISIIFIIGFLLYITTFFLWLVIIQKCQLTYASPMAYGIAYIVICIISYIALGEKISGIQYLGVILIILGVILISISKENSSKE